MAAGGLAEVMVNFNTLYSTPCSNSVVHSQLEQQCNAMQLHAGRPRVQAMHARMLYAYTHAVCMHACSTHSCRAHDSYIHDMHVSQLTYRVKEPAYVPR